MNYLNLTFLTLFILFQISSITKAQECIVNDRPIEISCKDAAIKSYKNITAIATIGDYSQGLDKKREIINITIADFDATVGTYGLNRDSSKFLLNIDITGPAGAWGTKAPAIKTGKITEYRSQDPSLMTIDIRFSRIFDNVPIFSNRTKAIGEAEILEITDNSVCVRIDFTNPENGNKIKFTNTFPLRKIR
jgi:hypothetical protein